LGLLLYYVNYLACDRKIFEIEMRQLTIGKRGDILISGRYTVERIKSLAPAENRIPAVQSVARGYTD
jgi:hypothetical protein